MGLFVILFEGEIGFFGDGLVIFARGCISTRYWVTIGP